MKAVTIPVMAKSRIGHFAESQILEALGVDMIDESEGNIDMFLQNQMRVGCVSCILKYGRESFFQMKFV